ncbi:MAG TPA: protein kinase [Terracidiphilus sp.]|jgi:outer membrane biosynthesis protein TonB|nr:protein kinase [Terracidiphilus sp.]
MSGVLIRQEWEGRTIEGKLPLLEWLGGNGDRGVFLTVRQGIQRAAIKLIAAEGVEADAYLAQWRAVHQLAHANLMPILECGRCIVDGADFVYLVTEHAEDVLSRLITERALSAADAAKVFIPVLNVLAYLHEHEVVHGHIKPSNILCAAGKWKIACDDLWVAGGVTKQLGLPDDYNAPESLDGDLTPAIDIWSVGITLVEAMTQRMPAWNWSTERAPIVPPSIPLLFAEAVREALRVDPAMRCSIAAMRGLLEGRESVPLSIEPSAAGPVMVVRAAAVPIDIKPKPLGEAPADVRPEGKRVAKWPVPAKAQSTMVAQIAASQSKLERKSAEDTALLKAKIDAVLDGAVSLNTQELPSKGDRQAVTSISVAAEVERGRTPTEAARQAPVPINAQSESWGAGEMPVEEDDRGEEPVGSGQLEEPSDAKPPVVAKPKERLMLDALGYSDPDREQPIEMAEPAPEGIMEEDDVAPDALFHRSIAYDDEDEDEERRGFGTGKFLLVLVALIVVAGVMVNHFHPEWIPWAALGEKVSVLRSSSSQSSQRPIQPPPTQTTTQPAEVPAPVATPGAKEADQPVAPVDSGTGKSATSSAAGAGNGAAQSASEAETATPKMAAASSADSDTPSHSPEAKERPQEASLATNAEGEVAERVLPTVAPGARSSMRRPIEVEVHVFVDRDGVVRSADSTNYGPGNYFARTAVRAAHAWRFNPPRSGGRPQPSEWVLRFNFTRGATDATATEEGR